MSNCPKCDRWPPPAGYHACRSCTFGETSFEGRIEQAYHRTKTIRQFAAWYEVDGWRDQPNRIRQTFFEMLAHIPDERIEIIRENLGV